MSALLRNLNTARGHLNPLVMDRWRNLGSVMPWLNPSTGNCRPGAPDVRKAEDGYLKVSMVVILVSLGKDGLEVAVMMVRNRCTPGSGPFGELKSSGFKIFVVLGSCGVLDESIAQIRFSCQTALRDEGLTTITPLSAMKSAMSLLCFDHGKGFGYCWNRACGPRPGLRMPLP